MASTRGRPRGSRNIKPSRKAVRGYYQLLREKAEQGDTMAAGWLAQLDLLNQKESTQ
ncbi:hypothetical protein [Marinobacter qingdaonensis]|uniref:Uncharacterized protein n=1 Tax=Marinobacter qingdaonensis TaxID=3108486 RepID=A0ABU5P1P2_9GAMM|nr:hypothetical protein [Marinobacter sp. ASW11-75]MEA1081974.1 hypothetical protein [Marinobacter sp. ASW11-75]